MLRSFSSRTHFLRNSHNHNNVPRIIDIVRPPTSQVSIGRYLAKRLVNAGLSHYFTVPGDFILSLLDELTKEKTLTMIGCCNELNAGYAADGYARSTGRLSAVVGGLSCINAIAGAYSDDLPVLCISGGPNNLDSQERHLVHHTIGETNLYQQSQCYEPIVAKTFVIRHPSEAAQMIDAAISMCIVQRKPVYLEIPVNLATFKIDEPMPMSGMNEYGKQTSDKTTLVAVKDAILQTIGCSVKPVLIAGSKLRKTEATAEFLQFADAMGCAVAIMPDAKSLFPESHNNFMGRYWGSVSSSHVAEMVESSDLILMAGPVLNDYTTTGWSALLPQDKSIILGPDYVQFFGSRYPNVMLKELLPLLTKEVETKENSIVNYHRYRDSTSRDTNVDSPANSVLTLRHLINSVQKLLDSNTDVIVETGDSWFMGQKLKLPAGCSYHVQMQYGSIGWSVGALLGIGLGWKFCGSPRRIIGLIGDGAFQVTVQEISTMIRHNIKATILLINNDGYTIEVQIHDGSYNDIKMWDYTKLIEVFNNNDGNGLGIKASTCGELTEALKRAEEHDGLCLIECCISRDDCTSELLEWGSRVARANGRVV